MDLDSYRLELWLNVIERLEKIIDELDRLVPTPRTDAQAFRRTVKIAGQDAEIETVSAEFARELERELESRDKDAIAWKDEAERLYKLLLYSDGYLPPEK